MTKQIETLSVIGTITTSGNALVTVTAQGMTNSPKDISVAVLEDDTASDVAQKVRYALAVDADASELYLVSGTAEDVTLTRRIDAANDTTLNIAIDNDTCDGLTPITDSQNITAGVPVDAYYITLADFKYYRKIPSDSTVDDEKILAMIATAQWHIEVATGEKFSATNTDRFFTPGEETDGLCLKLDKYISEVNSVTNGDGATLSPSAYIPYPKDPPYFEIRLKTNSGVVWAYTGNYERSITVNGKWSYTTTPPPNIKEAMRILTNFLYEKSSSPIDQDRQIITSEGIILPAGISKTVAELLEPYKHHV